MFSITSEDLSGKDLPAFLQRPSRDQKKRDACVGPIDILPASLIPGRVNPEIIPPRLYWGFRYTTERLREILVKNNVPQERIESDGPYAAFLILLGSTFYPIRIDYPTVLTSKVGEYANICSFGSNYQMKRMMGPSDIEKMQEKFGVKDEELKWWIDNERWHWDTRTRVLNRLRKKAERSPWGYPISKGGPLFSQPTAHNSSTETVVPVASQ
ncbi:hypothetical protein C8J56DRAFT_950042 [Mycena floridula]|nr:hypothetical protein C8J56DRAFT_950042 [Mycena floridula]